MNYIASQAVVRGDVRLSDEDSIWYNAVIRTESEPVQVGDKTNIQDGCVIHTDAGFPVSIGKGVTIGHGAIIHGARIEDDVLIGMGAVLMNGSQIGTQSIVAAGALVPEGKTYPPRSLILGVPARAVRALSEKEIASIAENAEHYVKEAAKQLPAAPSQS